MQTPKNIQRGEPITARWLNSLIELVMRRIRGGKGITIKRTSAGIIISQQGQGARDGSILTQNFRIVEMRPQTIKENYMLCNGSGFSLEPVAKPWHLRKSRYDDRTETYEVDSSTGQDISYTYDDSDTTGQTRTATDDTTSTSEEQTVVPNYVEFEPLLAMQIDTGIVDESGDLIEWIDLNVAGRTWGRAS